MLNDMILTLNAIVVVKGLGFALRRAGEGRENAAQASKDVTLAQSRLQCYGRQAHEMQDNRERTVSYAPGGRSNRQNGGQDRKTVGSRLIAHLSPNRITYPRVLAHRNPCITGT